MKKRFYIHTLGCKVNQYESQSIRESMLGAGFEESESRESADIYVINTCTVTEKADKESRCLISAFNRTNPHADIVVTGCYVEKDAGEVASLRGVSHIVKNSEKNRIADMLTGHPVSSSYYRTRITGFKDHTKAFVKIQDGCENACAYCKVPLVRGALKSRSIKDIVEEVEGLARNGFREMVLTGICLGAWGREYCHQDMAASFGLNGVSIIDLLDSINGISGDFRVRLSSIEPRYVTDKLIEFIRANRRFCRHFHIPMQSGDDHILKRMNRPYTAALYMSLIKKIRASIEDAAVTTDILIGFPGETDERFRNTLEFLRELSPARTHIFTFSRRPGTAAYDMDGGIDQNSAKRRYGEVEGVALNASYLFRRSFIGRTLDVLVENARQGDSGLLTGYTDNYIKVLFSGPDELMGRIVPVKITDTDPTTTMGAYAG